ncbi:MAG: hypothetical protein LBI48_09565 [Burkholderiaceae bacterium]|jgi:hypothetical protein|nr:hypothetical protein [Burkholderiaceae bacterium]
MNGQLDLFADAASHGQACVNLPGRWREPELTLPQLRAALSRAQAALPDVPEAVREPFSWALEAFRIRLGTQMQQLAERKRPVAEDQPFPYRNLCATLSETVLSGPEISRLMTLARQHDLAGVEIRTHHNCIVDIAAFYVPNVGTLELRHWPSCRERHANYAPVRTVAVQESYRDNRPGIALPYAIWRHACCMTHLSEARDGIADVPTFAHGGREYTVTAITLGQPLMQADAWTITPAGLWRGAAYNYSQLLAAYDAGNLERSDLRGQLVRVRGRLCVLEALTVLHDAVSAFTAEANTGENKDAVTDNYSKTIH